MKLRFALVGAALFFSAGAASAFGFFGGDVAPGTARDEVIARMGRPTAVVPLPGGAERLQYSQQPAGQYAWMVDVDANGRVTASRQALTQANFERIVPGQWTRTDVEREFGPPARIERVASWDGPIMTYRWRDAGGADMFYSVYLDAQGIVRRAHPSMEVRDRFFDFRF
ncbi:MAG TPA: hypothetical protein VHA82_13430 [Ramlibacter sp.]|uniref:hypothetical protein n=1 Tax=Ramlibacter sp. TaxID=1917967 RepID=UPI002C529A77|nr:hypothetical protein [Ramlibacter sp.]HVZ44806.1 hypothetical protein [Ramlibacter sp.]